MRTKAKKITGLLARVLVTTVLLVWVFSQVDFEHFKQTVRAAKWHYLIGVWLFTAAFFLIQSLAMKLILHRQDCEVDMNTLFGASCVTALYSMILPGILSTGVKWYILKRHTGKGSNVLSGMLYNQVMLSAAMTVIGLSGLIVTNPTRAVLSDTAPEWALPSVCGVLLIATVSICVLLLNSRTGGPVTRSLAVMLKPLPAAIREKGSRILTQIGVFQTAGLRFHLTIAFLNALDGLVIGLLIYLFAAKAARIDVHAVTLIWLCAVVFILGRLPVSVANLGVREFTLVTFLASYGVTESAALLMSMILFSSLIFMAAIGIAYQVLWLGRTMREVPRRAGGGEGSNGESQPHILRNPDG